MNTLAFAARSLRREFRYGELATLALALLLAVAALGAVGTLGARVEHAILSGAAELMGGDFGVRLRAPPPPAWREEAQRLGLRSSTSSDFHSVLFAGDKSRLADLRAVDPTWPLLGTLLVRDADGREHRAGAPAPGQVYVEHEVLVALGLELGAMLQLGDRTLKLAGVIVREPDNGQFFALAPRVLMTLADAEASGLLGPGSRVYYRFLLSGNEAALAAFRAYVRPQLPEGAELITLEQSQQNLRGAFERGQAMLRLAALLAALLAGIAVALAAQRFGRRKTDEVALLRCLGMSMRELTRTLVLELALLALPACTLGLLLGLALQAVVLHYAHALLPGALGPLPLGPSLAAFAVGLAVLFGFALPPLLRLREVPPVRVFQRAVSARVRRFDALYLLPLVVSALLIYAMSGALKLALILGLSLAGVALFALLLGAALMRLIGRFGRHLPGALRFGLANLARRRTLSLIQSSALALSLTALFLLAIVGPTLLGAWRAELRPDTPNYFLLNLQDDQRAAVSARLDAIGGSSLNMLPLAVGKLLQINGRVPKPEDYADTRAANWISGALRLSWSTELPPANRIDAGHWFAADDPTPQISVDRLWVDTFHLKLGDRLTLSVGEQRITATISSIRAVDWDSFRVNFFLLLNPAAAQALPHSLLASVHLPPEATAGLAALSHDYPNLSLIDINALLERVRELIAQVSAALQWVLGFSLGAGLLVLVAALNATAEERRFEAALLRTLGARRGQLAAAVLGEFALLGLLAGVIAALGAAGAGAWLARAVFKIGWTPPLPALLVGVLVSAALVTLSGWLGTRRIARTAPMAVLRKA